MAQRKEQRMPPREIQRLRMFKALERAAGSWNPKDHPELRQGAARWVAKLRQRDERLSRKRIAEGIAPTR